LKTTLRPGLGPGFLFLFHNVRQRTVVLLSESDNGFTLMFNGAGTARREEKQ
jgi:hypothetical protein